MSRTDFKQNWVAYSTALTTRFPDVPEAMLADADGDPDALVALLTRETGLPRVEVQAMVEEIISGPMPADAYADPTHDNAAVMDSGDYVPAGEDVTDDDARFGDDAVPDAPMGRDRT